MHLQSGFIIDKRDGKRLFTRNGKIGGNLFIICLQFVLRKGAFEQKSRIILLAFAVAVMKNTQILVGVKQFGFSRQRRFKKLSRKWGKSFRVPNIQIRIYRNEINDSDNQTKEENTRQMNNCRKGNYDDFDYSARNTIFL